MKIIKIIEWEPEDKLIVDVSTKIIEQGTYFVIDVQRKGDSKPLLNLIRQDTGKICSISSHWFDESGRFRLHADG